MLARTGAAMFERFTERARRVVVLAQEEARMLQHNYIGTEHLLLAVAADGQGIGAQALEAMGLSMESVRERVEELVPPGKKSLTGHIPFTPRAKKSLELALREALQLGDNYIGTEHILLGMHREGTGVAAQVLTSLGVQLQALRVQVIALSPGSTPQPVEAMQPRRLVVQPGAGIRARLQELSDRLDAIEAHLGISRPARMPLADPDEAGGGTEPGSGTEAGQPAGSAAREPDDPATSATADDG
jgi:ATP-dependent Clp protease ATP-binding subunit ClpA